MTYRYLTLFFLTVTAFSVTGCIFYGDDHDMPDDSLEHGPAEYRLWGEGELIDTISPQSFQTMVEWMHDEAENRTKALFYASLSDSIDDAYIEKTYRLLMSKTGTWPDPGHALVAPSPGNGNDIQVKLYGEHSETTVDSTGNDILFITEYEFTATGGNVHITTSNAEHLRGEFEMVFRRDRMQVSGTNQPEETIDNPRENARMIQGAFDINLQTSRVTSFSQDVEK